ncbi:tryptophan-rich antigen [Plasmodium cynomolgi strain B]|uniref:Tryptophan-rich antigen n=1 Tax=Plasmodium cynomolgi (strain B) TaxID=1120755 RepID=K6UNI9_PLACD|nr:tryptophan-rich antigen [Plasmodium cynomolgi strain B]GAB69538.1 tryptophan-rich antigen [Plasmodium cynomolgi strain B]
MKSCAQFVFLIFSLYIILKHFFPTVFKKLNNTLDSDTLNSIKYRQGYVDKLEEKGNTELINEEGYVFEDALEEVYTNEKEIKTGGDGIPVEEATNSHKEKEGEKGKGDNQVKESEPNVANINTNFNIEKNADVNNEVKGSYNISTVEGKDLNNKEKSDNNAKEGEKYNLMPENNDTVINLGGSYFLEKRGEHIIYDIKEEDENLIDNTKDDKDLTEAKGNFDNKAAYSMNVKNITSHVEKGAEASTSKKEEEGEKHVYEKEPNNYQIKNEGQENENTGTSYSLKRGADSYNDQKKSSSNLLEGVQEKNERETNNYKLKEGEENIQDNSTNDLSKLGEKDEQKTVLNNDKMELDTRKVKKK